LSRLTAVDDCIRAMTAARAKKRGLTIMVFNGHGQGRLSRLANVVAGMLGLGAAFIPPPIVVEAAPQPAPKPKLPNRAERKAWAREVLQHRDAPRDRKYLNASRTQRPDGSDW